MEAGRPGSDLHRDPEGFHAQRRTDPVRTDGYLYVGTGDSQRREQPQDKTALGGKILRITREGRPAPGNPFGDNPVYSLGHRNVQGLAWDGAGRLWASEFGPDVNDELNLIVPAATTAGRR